jgi:hypothetical protein
VSGAHYEAVTERDGIHVRVIVDLTDEAMYADADELAEAASIHVSRISREIREARSRAQVPF